MPGTHPELRVERLPGRPSLLTETVQKRLLDAVKLGVPVKTACEHAGIHANTFYRWMARGYSEHEATAQGEDPIAEETPYLELYTAVSAGRAEAAIRNVGLIQKSAQGGYVTKTTEKKYKDVETGQIIKEYSEDIASPDWRAAAWYLERIAPDEFGKDAVHVEVTGAGGGPIEMSQGMEELSARLAAHLAANPAITAIEATQVDHDPAAELVEAEIVES
jgi:hypothetical protein